jgi:hypothetical protein
MSRTLKKIPEDSSSEVDADWPFFDLWKYGLQAQYLGNCHAIVVQKDGSDEDKIKELLNVVGAGLEIPSKNSYEFKGLQLAIRKQMEKVRTSILKTKSILAFTEISASDKVAALKKLLASFVE